MTADEVAASDIDGSQADAWRSVEVQEAGKPTEVTGYR
jgi:hypothetical protein